MSDWFSDLWASLTLGRVLFGVGVFLGSLLLSFAAIAVVMVKIPANYFSSHYVQDFLPNSSWLVRWGAVILKNILGLLLILLGIVLSLPGVPGQRGGQGGQVGQADLVAGSDRDAANDARYPFLTGRAVAFGDNLADVCTV